MSAMDERRGALAERGAPATRADPQHTFEAFFMDHHGAVFGWLWLVTRTRQEAEEIMQDAFLKLWERWDRVESMADPVGYLHRTAMNLFRSRYRRARVAIRRAVGHLPPDDLLAAVEDRDAVVRALAGLPARQRAAIVLTSAMGFTSEEAARAMHVRSSTVRVLAARARASLRQEMGESDA